VGSRPKELATTEILEVAMGRAMSEEAVVRRLGSVRRTLIVAAVLGLVGAGALTWATSYTAFYNATANPGNTWAAGTVSLTDDDVGSAIFTTGTPGTGQVRADNLRPGQTVVNCIRVTYTGSAAATVKLYGSAISEAGGGGTALLAYLHVKVEEGTGGAFGCAGFAGASTVWDTSTHPGAASDLLGVFPTTYATGVSSGLASWTSASFRVYRFTITLDAATPLTSGGATATATFNWQAQNS
jgi:hypothetical protein